jgi:hypothetical protein
MVSSILGLCKPEEERILLRMRHVFIRDSDLWAVDSSRDADIHQAPTGCSILAQAEQSLRGLGYER